MKYFEALRHPHFVSLIYTKTRREKGILRNGGGKSPKWNEYWRCRIEIWRSLNLDNFRSKATCIELKKFVVRVQGSKNLRRRSNQSPGKHAGSFFYYFVSVPAGTKHQRSSKRQGETKRKKNKNKKSGEKYHPNTGAAGLGKDIGRIGTKNGESGREKKFERKSSAAANDSRNNMKFRWKNKINLQQERKKQRAGFRSDDIMRFVTIRKCKVLNERNDPQDMLNCRKT